MARECKKFGGRRCVNVHKEFSDFDLCMKCDGLFVECHFFKLGV